MIGTLVIFAKVPRPGRVKTRLATDLGSIAATWWYRHQLARLVRRVGHDPRWRTVLAVAPDGDGLVSPLLPAWLPRRAQGPGDLGVRMARALTWAPGPVLVTGSDIPAVAPADIAGAFAVLRGHDAVLGPATDGGFWLIGVANGARPLPPGLFRWVRWSGPHALADTLATLAPLRTGFAATLADVDRAADLERTSTRRNRDGDPPRQHVHTQRPHRTPPGLVE